MKCEPDSGPNTPQASRLPGAFCPRLSPGSEALWKMFPTSYGGMERQEQASRPLPTQYPNGLMGLELWKLASSLNSRGKGGAVSRFIVAHVLMIIAAFQERGHSNLWQLILRLLASRLPYWKIGFLMNLRILVTSLIHWKVSAMHCTPCHMFVAYSQNKASCFIYPPGCHICAIFSTIHTSTPLLRNLTARLNVLVLPLSMEPLRVGRNVNAFSTQG